LLASLAGLPGLQRRQRTVLADRARRPGGEGKSAEAFDPAGPWLVTPHEVPNATVIFKPAEIVHYLSQFLVLEHGDLINTVPPPGVGMGLTPPAG